MRVFFRADASDDIGFGHVMRTYALAKILQLRGHVVGFLTAQLPPHLSCLLVDGGFNVVTLSATHDAEEALTKIEIHADWLVVDHYELDIAWERRLRTKCRRILVIEDQPNRAHDCDLLLDQNLSTQTENDYLDLIPAHARCLLGPQWALLRPAFLAARNFSLARRISPSLEKILIFMGGGSVEPDVLVALEGVLESRWKFERVDIVLGQSPLPHSLLARRLSEVPHAQLHTQTPDMANLMAKSDLAITAGGSVSWEKCCLGLPSIVTTLAANQKSILLALNAVGAVKAVRTAGVVTSSCYAHVLDGLDTDSLSNMSKIAARLCSGHGAELVADELISEAEEP